MKVLAYRSNRIFVVAPIVIAICVLLLQLYFQDDLPIFGRRTRIRVLGFIFMLGVSMLCAFIERLCMPKVLIECDDCGLYIYKYRKSEPILLRYEDIIASHVTLDVGSDDITIGQLSPEQTGLVSNNAVGTLCIRIKSGDIRIRGIKNVKQVRGELNKKVSEIKRKQREEIDDLIERSRRERELSELAKHDPNT